MAICFVNPGEIDPRLIKFMGVNVKTSDDPIGFFGTGLKYALAILLREKQGVTVWSGLERFDFTAEAQEIRGKSFQFIHMNGENLGITLELGKNWKLWMAYRELFSNALDEDGYCVKEIVEPRAGLTVIKVIGTAFETVWANRANYFLESEALSTNSNGSIHGGKTTSMFYRNICVGQLAENEFKFTYNVKCHLDLTEDRNIRDPYYFRSAATALLASSRNKEVIKEALTARGFLEFDEFDYSYVGPSEEFLDVVAGLGTRAPLTAQKLLFRLRPSTKQYEEYEPTKLERRALEKALAFLPTVGFEDSFPIKFVVDLGQGVLGKAEHDTIWLTKATMQMGTKQIASTILEEFIHLEYKLVDKSRTMQTFLFDKIISLGEEITGEPL